MLRTLAAVLVAVAASGCLSVPDAVSDADGAPGTAGDGGGGGTAEDGGGATDAGADAQPPGACEASTTTLVDEFGSSLAWTAAGAGSCSYGVSNGLLTITNDNRRDGPSCLVRSDERYAGADGEVSAVLGALSGDATLGLRFDDGFAVVLHYDGARTGVQTCTADDCSALVVGPTVSGVQVLRLAFGAGVIQAAVDSPEGQIVVDTLVQLTGGCVQAELGVTGGGTVAWDAVNSTGGD